MALAVGLLVPSDLLLLDEPSNFMVRLDLIVADDRTSKPSSSWNYAFPSWTKPSSSLPMTKPSSTASPSEPLSYGGKSWCTLTDRRHLCRMPRRRSG